MVYDGNFNYKLILMWVWLEVKMSLDTQWAKLNTEG